MGVAAGVCASPSGLIADRKAPAVQAALSRGRFDLACPSASTSVLSGNCLPKAESGTWQGLERAELAIGVEGCRKRASCIVVCPDKTDTCMPAQPGGASQQPGATRRVASPGPAPPGGLDGKRPPDQIQSLD